MNSIWCKRVTRRCKTKNTYKKTCKTTIHTLHIMKPGRRENSSCVRVGFTTVWQGATKHLNGHRHFMLILLPRGVLPSVVVSLVIILHAVFQARKPNVTVSSIVYSPFWLVYSNPPGSRLIERRSNNRKLVECASPQDETRH